MNSRSDNFFGDFEVPDDVDLDGDLPDANPTLARIYELLNEVEAEEDLYLLKLHLEGRLPPLDLSKLDLETELATQLRDSRMLLAMTLHSPLTPANQKAQVMSTVTRALTAIASAQTEVYNAERVKIMERALITTLQGQENAAEIVAQFEDTFNRLLRSKK